MNGRMDRPPLVAAIMKVCAVLCLLLCGAGSFAVSETQGSEGVMLEISLEAQPWAMVEPEEVTLTFTITNSSSADAENIYLSSPDGLLYERIGSIASGDTQTLTRAHDVTEQELSNGCITYVISHDNAADADGRVNYTISTPIERSEAAPGVEFTRQLSSEVIGEGDTLTITYRVCNTGNVALSQLRVADVTGDFNGRIDRLGVGENRTLINRVTAGAEAITSSASLSYCVSNASDELCVQTLEDVIVPIKDAGIEADISAEYTSIAGDAARITLRLANAGNVDYPNLTVRDGHGAIIADHLSVSAGETVTVDSVCPIRGETEIIWHIAGRDAAGGNVDIYTEALCLVPADEGNTSQLILSAQAQTPEIRSGGDVKIDIHIENTGGTDIYDVVLSEAQSGDADTFAVVPAHGAIDRTVTRHVAQDAEFIYSVSYTDSDGWARTASAEPARVKISSDGVLPEGTKQSFIEFSGTSVKVGGSSLFAVLLIVALAVLLILIIILAVASRRARIEKQVRIAAEKQRRREKDAERSRKAKKGKA